MPAPATSPAPETRDVRALSGLLPFLRPYRRRIALAVVFLVLAAATTLIFPLALKSLIDQGFVAADPGQRVLALREHFFALFGVGVALGLFSAARFYMVSWLGERVTADLRNAVYTHVIRQSPEFFETTQTGEVLSRLTTDTTLVQTVVGSSLSLGLRNAVMGIGAMAMLVVTNPVVMTQVLGILVLIVLPSIAFGRRIQRLSRASQDRVADSSAIAAEVLNAIPVVQSYVQEDREAARFARSTEAAFATAVRRTRMRSFLVAFIISATFGALLWGLYQGTQAVLRECPDARMVTYGHLGDGNLHFNVSPPAGISDAAFLSLTPQINRAVHDLVAQFGGSISAEHGIGRLKREELIRYKSPVALQLMHSIKQAIDPNGIMNRGKVLAAPDEAGRPRQA